MMKILLLLAFFHNGFQFGETVVHRNEVKLPIAVLLPYSEADGNCTNKAIEMAVSDVNSLVDFIFRDRKSDGQINRTVYKFDPHYGESDSTGADAIEVLHRLFKNKVKISTVGPPFKDQNEYITEYTTANGNLHVSYSEANEPIETYFIMHFRSPPSIASSFYAAKSLMKSFHWSRTGMLYDYSDFRYRKNVHKLRDIVYNKQSDNNTNEVIADQGIWSIPVQYSVSKELGVLQKKGVRIVLTLVSVSGARKIFCEAYRRKMYQPKVTWVLFETLPKGWASSKYDAFETVNGTKREINCTEDELLTAADGYISIVNQGLRRDNNKTVSNMTANDFRQRLQVAVGPKTKCNENVAYAYDAIWVLAKGYQAMPEADILSYFYHDFGYTIKLAKTIKALKFEALTGPLKYISEQGANSRIGQTTLYVNHKGADAKYFGTHDTSSNVLNLLDDTTKIVFKSGIIPKDRAVYKILDENFNEALMIVMWLFCFLGILMAVSFLVVALILMKYKYHFLSTPIIDCILLIGSILCYLSVIIYAVDTRYVAKETVPRICTTFLCILSLGFTLAFGSLFAKTWRLYKLYMTPEVKGDGMKQTEQQHVPEWVLLLMVVVIVIGDIILLTCWAVTAPFDMTIQNITTSSNQFANVIEIKQIVRCNCEKQTQFTIGIYCYKGLLLIFGLFLAWQTRNGKLKCKSDSKKIAMAIYNVVAVSVIGVVCLTVLANTTRQQAMFSIIAVCIIICTTTTLLLVFVEKIRRLLREDRRTLRNSISRSMSSSKESPKTKYTLEYMRKPVGSLDLSASRVSTNTLSTHMSSTESPTSVHFTKYGGSTPRAGSIVSVTPSYLHSSSYIPPPEYSDVNPDSSLKSGIYIGSISEENEGHLSSDDGTINVVN